MFKDNDSDDEGGDRANGNSFLKVYKEGEAKGEEQEDEGGIKDG